MEKSKTKNEKKTAIDQLPQLTQVDKRKFNLVALVALVAKKKIEQNGKKQHKKTAIAPVDLAT